MVELRLPVNSHPLDIPQRLQEIDPDLRVFFNTELQQYEVWGLDQQGPYLMARFGELDQRVLRAVRKGYFIARSTGRPYKHLLHEQDELDWQAERRRQRGLDDLSHAFADDMRGLFRQLWPGWRAS